MAYDPDPLELHLLEQLGPLEPGEAADDRSELEAVWRAQVESRHCDFASRYLQTTGRSFYTIGSAGHESNACVAFALRPTDPALLHYRSGAFYLARAAQTGHDGVPDIMRGVTAARDEPIAGGRHKVFGHADLAIIPQTSTIASHLPRAFGVAFAIERAKKLGVECPWPSDGVVVCSFGDASLNHATAQAALNSAAHTVYQGLPLPLLFLCEDNGLGISVPSPQGWVEQALLARAQLRYAYADGTEPEVVVATARELVDWIREHRRPAVLHLRTVRFLSHAGADVEAAYRTPQAIRADWDADPLLATGRALAATAGWSGERLVRDYTDTGVRVRAVADEVARIPQLDSAAEIVRPLAPRSTPRAGAQAGLAKWRPDDARAGDQHCTGDRARTRPHDAALRRGRRRQGRRLRCHARSAEALRRRARLRHAARRDVDPRPRARRCVERFPAGAGDPVPRVPAQRGGSAAGRRRDAAVLLAGPVPERHGRADCGVRLPEGVWWPFPQRQRGRRAARHSRPGDRLAGAARRRERDAGDLPRDGARGRQRVRLSRADRALPHA